MLSLWRKPNSRSKALQPLHKAVFAALEPLENRQMMSFGWGGFPGFGGFDGGHDGGGFGGGDFGGGGPGGHSITFNLAPSAVQTGLNKLATADGLTDPASTSKVFLNNANGVETYSVTINGTGTVSTLTVDQLGDAVTAPIHSTTTWATLSGTGTGSDSAAATEISTIATALNLTAPASTDTVNVSNSSSGAITYSIQLGVSNTSSGTTADVDWGSFFGTNITVDSAGNPVGNQHLPFSVFSSTIQNALNGHAPTGATALAATSTQNVDVQTTDGVTTYSTDYSVSGVQTTVTVDAAGKLTSLPTTTTTTFSALSASLQTELQTLATADGVTTAIASTQSVSQLTETNGTILYSVTLPATGTDNSGSTYTFDVTITVDSNGNPTTQPNNGFEGGGFGFGDQGFGRGWHHGFGGGFGGDCDGANSNSSTGTTSNSSTGSSSSNSSTAALTLPAGSSASPTSQVASTAAGLVQTRLIASTTAGLGVAGYLTQFSPVTLSAAVQTDLSNIAAALAKTATDTKALTPAQKVTLKADEKAIASATKALASLLAPLEKTLKADTAANAAVLKSDQKLIAKNRRNATALAAAKAQLAADKTAAFAAIARDESAIQSAINNSSTVASAKSKLAADLPIISSDQKTVAADQAQLVSDIAA